APEEAVGVPRFLTDSVQPAASVGNGKPPTKMESSAASGAGAGAGANGAGGSGARGAGGSAGAGGGGGGTGATAGAVAPAAGAAEVAPGPAGGAAGPEPLMAEPPEGLSSAERARLEAVDQGAAKAVESTTNLPS